MYREQLKHRMAQGGLYAAANAVVSFAVAMPFLFRAVREVDAPVGAALLMLASTVAALNLIVYAVQALATLARAPRALWIGLGSVGYAFIHTLLVADFRLFSLFKFHINGLAVNLLFTEGAGETTSLGGGTLLTLTGIGVLLLVANLAFGWALTGRWNARISTRRFAWTPLAMLLLFAADKAVYAWSDLTDRHAVVSATRYFPFYARVTVNRAAARLGFVKRRTERVKLDSGGKALRYPLRAPAFGPGAPRPNVVLLMIDGLRADMLRPDVMPALSALADESILFTQHYSSGNGTRFGTFGLLYGLNGNLWHAFLQSRQAPAWIEPLRQRDYRFLILSSSKLTYPEFRKTAFVTIEDCVRDHYPADNLPERDRAMTADFIAETRAAATNSPFFACLFFNSTHVTYHYPPEFERFKPVAEDSVNYMRDITPAQFDGLRNRYMNSLFFLDSLVRDIVATLREQGLLDTTILAVTGDHGQEFGDAGFYGHNSAFDSHQLHTPLILRMPGRSPQRVSAMTSHLDVMPTILNRLGCVTPPSEYAHGRDLFTGEARTSAFVVDWNGSAIVMPGYALVVPPGLAAFGSPELRNLTDYRPAVDRETMARGRAALVETVRETARFLR